MGQYDTPPAATSTWSNPPTTCVASQVRNPAELRYVTQTTLSKDDTAIIIDCLYELSPKSRGRKKKTSAMPRKTGRTRSNSWPNVAT